MVNDTTEHKKVHYTGLNTDWTGFEFETEGRIFVATKPLAFPHDRIWKEIHGFDMTWEVQDKSSGHLYNAQVFDFMDRYIRQLEIEAVRNE